ncbi:hemerythrin domain-containing protein [Nonomuraea sp. NPDC023979]|uniref:hemerythrin domain-containing protein n=1 Tax=Nonomuraea sp. NPDC023979 TaxID=3154796 RepID=UPI00340EF58E
MSRPAELRRHARTSAARPRDGETPHTLTGEHAQLLAQVTARARALLAAAARGGSPEREARALTAYLRAEVIRQIRDEEWLLFPAYGAAPALSRLTRDHARLRAAVDAITRAASDSCPPARLATLTRDLLTQLGRHFATEERVLAALGRPAAATAALGAQPHRWFPLTEGPVIDLDTLPQAAAADAVRDRLRRLGRDEAVELRSGHDLNLLCWQLADGDYGFTYLREGPGEWRVRVRRR